MRLESAGYQVAPALWVTAMEHVAVYQVEHLHVNADSESLAVV